MSAQVPGQDDEAKRTSSVPWRFAVIACVLAIIAFWGLAIYGLVRLLGA